jgi:hypothetical protein
MLFRGVLPERKTRLNLGAQLSNQNKCDIPTPIRSIAVKPKLTAWLSIGDGHFTGPSVSPFSLSQTLTNWPGLIGLA